MKNSDNYIRVVEWSDEDQCYVGRSPGLMVGGCHGDDKEQVRKELDELVELVVESYLKIGDPLPPPTVQQPERTHPARNVPTAAAEAREGGDYLER